MRRLMLCAALVLTGCDMNAKVDASTFVAMETPVDWNTVFKGHVFDMDGTPCLKVRRANLENCNTDKPFSLACIEEHVGQFSALTPKGCGLFYMLSLSTCTPDVPANMKMKCRVIVDGQGECPKGQTQICSQYC